MLVPSSLINVNQPRQSLLKRQHRKQNSGIQAFPPTSLAFLLLRVTSFSGFGFFKGRIITGFSSARHSVVQLPVTFAPWGNEYTDGSQGADFYKPCLQSLACKLAPKCRIFSTGSPPPLRFPTTIHALEMTELI
jgi:hypothetical protein